MNQYEAMFLFDPTFASDFGKAKEEIERILGRAAAEIVFLEKWDERRLAYEIAGRKRGCYVLTYFRSTGDKIKGIERDAQLSEDILRILVRRADGITPEQMTQYLPQSQGADDEGFGDSGDDSDFDDDRPRRRGGGGPAPRRSRRSEGGTAVADSDEDRGSSRPPRRRESEAGSGE